MNFLFSELNKQQKSSPPSSTNDISEEYFYNVKKLINEKYKCTFDRTVPSSNDTLRETDVKKVTVKEIENELNHKTEHLLRLYSTNTSDVDNYPYQLALILDKRNCFDIFIQINKESNLLFRSIFIKSKYELVSLNICYFLFFLGLLFTINTVFYNDDLILKKLFDIATISDIFFRMLLAMIVTFVIMKIISYFKYYAPFFDMLEIEVKDCDVLGEHIRKRINDIKCKMITFYSLIVLCSFFFLYYLTIFCIVYKTQQMSWFISAWLSLAIYFALCFVYAILFSVLKVLALKYQLKWVYNFLLYIKSSYQVLKQTFYQMIMIY